jgi:hypothetical protein
MCRQLCIVKEAKQWKVTKKLIEENRQTILTKGEESNKCIDIL